MTMWRRASSLSLSLKPIPCKRAGAVRAVRPGPERPQGSEAREREEHSPPAFAASPLAGAADAEAEGQKWEESGRSAFSVAFAFC